MANKVDALLHLCMPIWASTQNAIFPSGLEIDMREIAAAPAVMQDEPVHQVRRHSLEAQHDGVSRGDLLSGGRNGLGNLCICGHSEPR
ncbi:hypothetical protein GGQ68_004934 [Sagittula marina]|uniref:Uncharacterized protein n=1 Tax=Sagittula marina TaxID=943940 RepID=A0A7W6GUH4_9RHOB|nr:hypothetical protein [Sagittula marina]MBB3988576.1 hypothetical protein [Sagittula marina]